MEQDTIKTTMVTEATPVGTISYFSGMHIPNGWLHCDGSYMSKVTYSDLYEVIGNLYGESGNTFRLPDFRGQFLRSYDSAAGVDPGRALGTKQGDAIRNITGTFGCLIPEHHYDMVTGAFHGASNLPAHNSYSRDNSRNTWGFGFKADRVVPTAAENRPKNAAVITIIKY